MAEHFLKPRQERAPKDQQFFLACAALSAAALFLTPLGSDLLEVPFAPMAYNHLSIGDDLIPSISEMTSLHMYNGALTNATLFNFLLGAAGLSLIASFARRNLRLSHVLFLAGGIFLTMRGERCKYECSLLILPLIAANPPFELEAAQKIILKSILAPLAAVLLLIMPGATIWQEFAHRPHYPASRRNLPFGVVSFLRHIDCGGKIWNHPNYGGYLEWALYPRYSIAGSMLLSFGDKDLYLMTQSFNDSHLLRLALDRYHPDFIAAPVYQFAFPEVVSHFPNYVLIFYDDASALYIDRKQHPDIAQTYALKDNPFQTRNFLGDPDKKFQRGPFPSYLSRMITIDPGCLKTRWSAAQFYVRKGDFTGELAQGEAVIQNYPESHFGYLIKGDALKRLMQYEPALTALHLALARSTEPGSIGEQTIYHEIAAVYQARKQFAQAFNILRKIEGPILPPDAWLLDGPADLSK